MFIFHAINNDIVHLFTVEGELQIHRHHDHDQNLSEEQTKKKSN